MSKKQNLNPILIDNQYSRLFNLYRKKLSEYYSRADMAGVMEASEDIPVNLRDIYVPLRIDKQDIPRINNSKEVEKIKGIDLDLALNKNHFLAISGLPGSGKTTLTHFLSGELSKSKANKSIQLLGRQLVIPIVLRELNFDNINSFEQLFEQWRTQIQERLDLELPKEFFELYINNHWALVIFDGFDEVDESVNSKLIKWIDDWIDGVIKKKRSNAENSFYCIITARPSGFLSQETYSKNFSKYYLQPFNREQIKQYVNNWYKVRYPIDSVKQISKTKNFIEKLDQFRGLAELKHRPIYLAMLAYVAETFGELPLTRTLAYSKMVDAYIHQLELLKKTTEKQNGYQAPSWSYDDKLRVMEELAFRLHTKACLELKNITKNTINTEQMQVLISKVELNKHIYDIIESGRFNSLEIKDAEALTKYFIARTGLLIEPKQDFYQFSHLTFQEFLTAKRIYRKLSKRNPISYLKKNIFDTLSQTGWHEVALLYFGIDTLSSGEDHNYILQYCFNEDNEAHQSFIIDLLMTTDHTLTESEVIAYLNTLIYIWLTAEKPQYRLYHSFSKIISKDKIRPQYYKSVNKYLAEVLNVLINNSPLEYSNSLIQNIDIEDDERQPELIHRLTKRCNNKADINRLFEVTGYIEDFRCKTLTPKIIRSIDIETIPDNKQMCRTLTYYLDSGRTGKKLSKEVNKAISKKCFELSTIKDFIADDMIELTSRFVDFQLTGLIEEIKNISVLGWYTSISMFHQKNNSDTFTFENEITPSVSTFNFNNDNDNDREGSFIVDGRMVNNSLAMIFMHIRALKANKKSSKFVQLPHLHFGHSDTESNIAFEKTKLLLSKVSNKHDLIPINKVNITSEELCSLSYHYLLLSLISICEEIAKANYATVLTKTSDYQLLYEKISNKDAAIDYFKQKYPNEVDVRREKEIEQWLIQTWSPRNQFKSLLESNIIEINKNELELFFTQHCEYINNKLC